MGQQLVTIRAGCLVCFELFRFAQCDSSLDFLGSSLILEFYATLVRGFAWKKEILLLQPLFYWCLLLVG